MPRLWHKKKAIRSTSQATVGFGARNFSNRSFHSLRHGFASALANAGVSEEIRMKLTGHRSSDIHQKYTHMNTAPLKEAIDSLRSSPNATTVP